MSNINNTSTQLPETGFIRLPQLLAIFPVSRSGFWAGVKSGKYPKPVKLSPRCTAWKVEDVRQLIASYDDKVTAPKEQNLNN